MSALHLRALESALARRGWRVITVHPGDGYRASATWELQRGGDAVNVFVDFDGMSLDGGGCLPLEESYACHLRGQESPSLYFRRVNRSRTLWEQELAEFVQSLDNGKPT
jgi:hypothetical protein